MKTKKKFGMRRHIGITAAATLIALGATACEEAYWGKTDGESNKKIYDDFVDHFGSEDGRFSATLVKEDNENCLLNKAQGGIRDCRVCKSQNNDCRECEKCDECTGCEDSIVTIELNSILDYKILLTDGSGNNTDAMIAMCSSWSDGDRVIKTELDEYGQIKLVDGVMDNDSISIINDVCTLDDKICKNEFKKLTCDDISYYLISENTGGYVYSKHESRIYKGLIEFPEVFKSGFNYRVCPVGYDYRTEYVYNLRNVCVKSTCNNASVNLYTDNLNCGGCGLLCKGGYTCVNGTCKIANEDTVNCNGDLIDPKSDRAHCGARGMCSDSDPFSNDFRGYKCGEYEACNGVKCEALDKSKVLCGNKQINPENDTKHCGASGDCNGENAGTECKGITPLCSGGKCVSTCVGGQIVCNRKCIDPKVDNTYCGAKGECNSASASDENYRGQYCADGTKCTEGTCKISCVSGQIACDGECIDPNTNPYFCGATGNCEGSNRGTDCTNSPTNKLCANKTCTSSCPTGQTQCDGFCINMNATNVSSCNNNTIQCKVGYGNCDNEVPNGCEVNTNNDNAHCGGCARECNTTKVSKSQSVQCSGGICMATSCESGYVLKEGKCELSDTLDCCGAKCKNCRVEYPNMKSGTCDKNKSECSLDKCNDGYMLNDTKTKCIEVDCSEDGQCGNSGKCIGGKCKCGEKSACSGNTPICSDTKACVACTSETHCPSKLNYTATCKNNTCDYQCNTGYHEDKKNGICVKNTTENCGSDGKCKDDTPYCEENKGKCVKCTSKSHCSTNGTGVCDTDTNTCVYTTCSEGYTLSENHDSCVPTKTRCGTSATDCTKIENISDAPDAVSCVNGYCKITRCVSNYHPHNSNQGENQTAHDECKADSPDDCGNSHSNCSDQYPSEYFDSSCKAGTCKGTCKKSYTECTNGETVLCLREGNGWGRGVFKKNWNATNCSNCVAVEGCQNGQFCNLDSGNPEYTCTDSK